MDFSGRIIPYLPPVKLNGIWQHFAKQKCWQDESAKRWLELFNAVSQRSAPRIREAALLIYQKEQQDLSGSTLKMIIQSALLGFTLTGDTAGKNQFIQQVVAPAVQTGKLEQNMALQLLL